jgi:hypothetical protein
MVLTGAAESVEEKLMADLFSHTKSSSFDF